MAFFVSSRPEWPNFAIPMDYAFERDWQRLLTLMEERFGEQPDLTTMVFSVGLQEVGQGARRYKKDEKVDLMHVGVCTLSGATGTLQARGRGRRGLAPFCRGGAHPCAHAPGARIDDEAGARGVLRRVDSVRRRVRAQSSKHSCPGMVSTTTVVSLVCISLTLMSPSP